MKRLSRILVAVAIDERDRPVFAQALTLARRHGAKLLILHAASPHLAFNRGATQRVDFLRRLRAHAEAAGVETRVTVQAGATHEIIVLHARARQADLIVLGTASSGRRRGLSGWIAERVLSGAPCPTLIVPHTAVPASSSDAILCGVDFSPASHAAVREAVRLSDGGARPVTLLHVVDGPGASEPFIRGWLMSPAYHRELGADALEKLRFLVPPPQRAAVTPRVAIGHPADEILAAAQAIGASLIVIGATGRTRVGSRLFGKTAQLLRDADRPILAVPLPAAAAAGTDHVTPLAA